MSAGNLSQQKSLIRYAIAMTALAVIFIYAAYLVRYLKGMQAEGVPIAALTMQNEPLNPKNTPSMVMEATKQEAFLRDAFGPALRAAGLKTRVVLYDHNCDRPDYPLTILADPKAAAWTILPRDLSSAPE